MPREQFLKKLRQEMQHIKIHQEDDWDWYVEGMEFLRNEELEKAEKIQSINITPTATSRWI